MTSLEGWDSAIELHPRVWLDRRSGVQCTGRTPGLGRPCGTCQPPSTVVAVSTLYDRVGGQSFFDQLVERFYEGVVQDPILRRLYPDDLSDPKKHLALFLGQYWGGPTTYSDERGHPRLRMRHAPFVIGLAERDAWLRHIVGAVRASEADDDVHGELIEYLEMASRTLINAR
jgi:hemoglobin